MFALLVATPAVHADKRVALVIGNAKYVHEGELDNPGNDARAVAAALNRIKFDEVEVVLDADLNAMQSALARFARKADAADLALIYYSGHGIEVDGTNYLIPISAKLIDAGDADFETVPLDQALKAADRAGKVKIVVLDACRNNPFRARMLRSARQGKRSVGRGLAAPAAAANGMLVAYAARAGSEADDGPKGGNGPFTAAFLKFVEQPRVDVRIMLGRVRDEVVRATGRQEPFTYGSLGGEEVFLNAAGAAAAVTVLPGPAPSPAPARLGEAAEAWASLKDSTDVRDLEAYRRQYGQLNPFYDRLAERRIEVLKQQQAALTPPPLFSSSRAPLPLKPTEEGALKPKDSFKECGTCPEMVVVPAGSFTMGSPVREEDRSENEGPQRQVTIANTFGVGKYEVSFAEWDACVSAGGCSHRPSDEGWGRGKRPVINVSWGDITKEYLPWLSRTTGKNYRLLTEAEWEYAARAGTTTPFSWGSSISTKQANYNGEYTYGGGAKGEYRKQTVPVDSFAANPWGFYNVHGNVWEWVQDCWHDSYDGGPTDGSAWVANCSENKRVLRGGSWINSPNYLRVASRIRYDPAYRHTSLGFRVARQLTRSAS
jgi:formylglycine-generating enzyme required for sulfatase activity/uncharacterized caspase-like protein